jgi:hypothetical protein
MATKITTKQLESLVRNMTPAPWETVLQGEGSKVYAEISQGDDAHVVTELYEPIAVVPADDCTVDGLKEIKANAKLLGVAPVVAMEVLQLRSALAASQARVAELEKAIDHHFDERHEVIGGNPDRIGDAELWAHIGIGRGPGVGDE